MLTRRDSKEGKKVPHVQCPCWEVGAPRSFPAFLRSLAPLFPDNAVLYFEGGDTTPEIRSYLEARKAEEKFKIPGGTIWPSPETFHMPLTGANLEGLAALLEKKLVPDVCEHVHVYSGTVVLLQWYDASAGDPILISKGIPEERVKVFCDALHVAYRESTVK